LSGHRTQQPTIYGKGKQQLAMRARGQWLAMGSKSVLRPLTIESTITPQWLACTLAGSQRTGRAREEKVVIFIFVGIAANTVFFRKQLEINQN
jgi:hypothetical protein